MRNGLVLADKLRHKSQSILDDAKEIEKVTKEQEEEIKQLKADNEKLKSQLK